MKKEIKDQSSAVKMKKRNNYKYGTESMRMKRDVLVGYIAA
jgi:hypothetical protein